MSWWERPLDRIKGRIAASPERSHHQPGPPVDAADVSRHAWSDVPPVQRTLADPIQPVAINDRFRDSLASFADPSFLAPLSHQVDPSVGGLVRGLVSPGEPQTHGGPELVLPQHAPARPRPSIQRLPSWSAPEEDLDTVPLEYLYQPTAEQSTAAYAEPEATSDPSTSVRADAGSSDPAPSTFSGPPQVQRVPATSGEHPHPLVAVSRAEDQQLASRWQGTDPADLPVAAPMSMQSAAAHGEVEMPESRTDALAAGGAEVQRVITDSEPVPAPGSTELPVTPAVSSVTGTGTLRSQSDQVASPAPAVDHAVPSRQRSEATPADAPILGVRPVPAPLSFLDEPLGAFSTVSAPVAQRVRYEAGGIQPQGTAPRPVPSVPAKPGVGGPALRGADPVPVTVQSLSEHPSADRRVPADTRLSRLAGPDDLGGAPGHVTPEATPPRPVAYEDARDWPEVSVSRFAVASEIDTDVGADAYGFVEAPLPVAWGQAASSSAATSPSVIDPSDVGVPRASSSAAAPWTGQTVGSPARMAAPIVAVQRRVADRENNTPRPDVTVQTQQVARSSPSGAMHHEPLVVAPGAVARTPVGETAPGPDVSFESMFAGFASSPATTWAERDDSPHSVQRQVSDGSPTVSEPTVSMSTGDASAPASAARSAAAGPDAMGSSGGNLDEVARRLYEPLAARLREELWLDRERAGWMSDV